MLLRDLRVLIVDDNLSDRIIVKAMLKEIHVAAVHEAESAMVASSKLGTATEMNDSYDLMLLDWNMPGTGGYKFLRQIQPIVSLRKMKIIVMTSTSNQEIVEAAVENGVKDFIVKPVELELLRKKLEALFGSQQ